MIMCIVFQPISKTAKDGVTTHYFGGLAYIQSGIKSVVTLCVNEFPYMTLY